ncbi:MAG TPA: vWA domain-containing protein [Polyangia bacterium]|jgi:hypothetical protein
MWYRPVRPVLVGLVTMMLAACGASPAAGAGDAGLGDGRDVVTDRGPVGDAGACVHPAMDPTCGRTCATTAACGANLYCDGTQCRADCTPGGTECGAGMVCLAHGLCGPDCPRVAVDLTLVVPRVVILIDQSGSMTSDFNGRSRWQAVKVALTDPTTGVVPALQSQVIFGATLYTSHNGTAGGGTCPILTVVDPALDNATAIRDLLATHDPDTDTPTGESIDAVVAAFAATPPNPDGHEGPRIIILATDGEPDTCAVPNPQTGQARAIQGAQNAFNAGIRMFMLSVGNEVGAAHMQDMANAGVGLAVGGTANAPYYVANDTAGLITAFQQIIGAVRSCSFTLSAAVQPGFESQGDVRLNGDAIGYQDPNGWTLTNPTTLELLGTACQQYLADQSVTLAATFPCGSIIE